MDRELQLHVAESLKREDRDRYLASLILPQNKRPYVQALFGFCAEIASIRSRITEPAAGEIRLQWWTEALQGSRPGEMKQNPLSEALHQSVETFGLPPGSLIRLIAARRFDLYDDPMPDMETFEGYAGETASTPLQLAAMILNDGEPVENGDAAGHLGVAQALTGHLRALGFNAAQGRIFLPISVLAAHSVAETELFAGRTTPGLVTACAELRTVASDHLDRARTAIANLPRHLRPAFAVFPLIDAQLTVLERNANQPLRPPQEVADWRKILHLLGWTRRA
jgi:phytoene synthase